MSAAALDACRWLIAYHEKQDQPIVTYEEYMRRAREAVAASECPQQSSCEEKP